MNILSNKAGIVKIISLAFLSLITLSSVFSNVHAAPGCGDYPGIYTFTEDIVGQDPNDWIVTEYDGDIRIENWVGDHHKVVGIIDNDHLAYSMMEQGIRATVNGSVEFWALARQTDLVASFIIMDADGVSDSITFFFSNDGHIKYGDDDGATNLPVDTTYEADTWIHVRINFHCDSTLYKIYINGVPKGKCEFRGNPDIMEKIRIGTSQGEGEFYIDAIGYTWEEDYDTGDNLEESCSDSPEATVPGYDLLIVFAVSSIVGMVFYLKKKKNL